MPRGRSAGRGSRCLRRPALGSRRRSGPAPRAGPPPDRDRQSSRRTDRRSRPRVADGCGSDSNGWEEARPTRSRDTSADEDQLVAHLRLSYDPDACTGHGQVGAGVHRARQEGIAPELLLRGLCAVPRQQPRSRPQPDIRSSSPATPVPTNVLRHPSKTRSASTNRTKVTGAEDISAPVLGDRARCATHRRRN